MSALDGRKLAVAAMAGGPVTPDLVREVLTDVIDPELGIDIINLGLVYDVAIGDGEVGITMTLTTPGCPLGAYLDDEVGRALAQLPGSPRHNVNLVFDPPWSPDMMTDEAKRMLGWYR